MNKRLSKPSYGCCPPGRWCCIAVITIAATVLIGCAGTSRYTTTRQPEKKGAIKRAQKPEKKSAAGVQTQSKPNPKPRAKSIEPAPRAVESSLLPLPLPRLISRFRQNGLASYYALKFHGRRTASGERYDKHALTAAHPKLPFGTRVRVTNLSNGTSVIVRINDRGPFTKKRIIDLSYFAAQKIGMIRAGTAKVSIETVEP